MFRFDDLEPELREAVKNYRHYGHQAATYDHLVAKYDRDEDYVKLREALDRRAYWQGKITGLIKGREKELFWVLIG
ncbi:MAG: hypothetical protein A4E28_01233 [Methanocella sp. PtaU1.Bin125]|nr:MAG: hypothetical protein A4E28_01233 [Methanocella sp. PtaU1.Bin125]